MQTPKNLAYLAEAEKCEQAVSRTTLTEVRAAYQSLADQWRSLARQTGMLVSSPLD